MGSSPRRLHLLRTSCFAVCCVRSTGVHVGVAVKERQYGPEYQKDVCFVRWTISLIEVLVMTNEPHLGR
jgi:hypothetical protein